MPTTSPDVQNVSNVTPPRVTPPEVVEVAGTGLPADDLGLLTAVTEAIEVAEAMTDVTVSGIAPSAVSTTSPDVQSALSATSPRADQVVVVAVEDIVVMTVVETEMGRENVDPLQRSVRVTGSARVATGITSPVTPIASNVTSPNRNFLPGSLTFNTEFFGFTAAVRVYFCGCNSLLQLA